MHDAVLGNAMVRQAMDVACSELSDEIVILNLDSGMCYGLGEVGATVWQLLQKPQTVDGLRDALLSEYDVERERCESDLRELLGELAAVGLIEVCPR